MIKDRELTELTEYAYTGISGEVYHPSFKDGKWQLCGINYDYSFYDIIYLKGLSSLLFRCNNMYKPHN